MHMRTRCMDARPCFSSGCSSMTVSDPWRSGTSPVVKEGAAVAVLAAHTAVVAALMLASPEEPELDQPQTVQVRFVEIAPDVQEAQAPAGEPASPPAEPVPEPAEPEPEPTPAPQE